MLDQHQINIIIETLKPFNPKKIGIFGSYARGENTEDSDIDILYEFDAIYSLFDLMGMKLELEKRLDKEIDMVAFTAIHPVLEKRILSDTQIVYEK